MYSFNRTREAFTLIEVLLAILILGMVATVTMTGFSAAARVWNRATSLSDNLHHADFVMDQLVMGLRSAYYREGYGFEHENDGDGPYARDSISWVKLGRALVDPDARFVESPHRVRFFIDQTREGTPVAAAQSWLLFGQPDDFDPDTLEPLHLSRRVTGFSVRTAHSRNMSDEIDWLDTWEETNRIPRIVELTLYLQPVEGGEAPLPVRRIVEIPAGASAW